MGDTKPMLLDKVIVELIPDGSGMLTVNACLVYGKWADTSLEIIPESPLINPQIALEVSTLRVQIKRVLDHTIPIPDTLRSD